LSFASTENLVWPAFSAFGISFCKTRKDPGSFLCSVGIPCTAFQKVCLDRRIWGGFFLIFDEIDGDLGPIFFLNYSPQNSSLHFFEHQTDTS